MAGGRLCQIGETRVLMVEQLSRSPFLAEVSFSLATGQVYCLMGPSGVGKSVLLRALADLEPHRGEVIWRGQKQSAMPAPQWRRKVMWFGAETAWWHDSVQAHFDEVAQWRAQFEKNQKNAEESQKSQNSQSCLFAEDFRTDLEMGIARLGLTMPILQKPVWQLSSGEKQRLALLRGLLLRPEVLLLDEVTANLDGESTKRVEAWVQAFVAEGERTVLWVTHDVVQAARLTQQVWHLDKTGLRQG